MDEFSRRILRWYARHQRKLPWRGQTDPYAVWISEVMLQQTRVEAVLAYYERWMKRFPDVPTLAQASEQEVLSAWEGLGYYGRARNLHKTSRIVRDELGGELPRDWTDLGKLPGVGRYTAAAIASIAFGQDVATLDGNIRRVLARVFDVKERGDSARGSAAFWQLAEQHLPRGRAGEYNQALMDLGATICLPRKPRCPRCPLTEMCKARAGGFQERRPVRKPKAVIPQYTVTAAVLRRDGRVLLARRPSKGLLGGLWEFPGGKVEKGETLPECLAREIREELGARIEVGESLGVYQHAYTHFRITLHAFACTLVDGELHPLEAAELAWVAGPDLAKYPMGKVDRLIARRLP